MGVSLTVGCVLAIYVNKSMEKSIDESLFSLAGTGSDTVLYYYDQLGDGEGVASAAALVLFVLIFAVTLVNLAVSKKNTHY